MLSKICDADFQEKARLEKTWRDKEQEQSANLSEDTRQIELLLTRFGARESREINHVMPHVFSACFRAHGKARLYNVTCARLCRHRRSRLLDWSRCSGRVHPAHAT
jgi:hypothetical protein